MKKIASLCFFFLLLVPFSVFADSGIRGPNTHANGFSIGPSFSWLQDEDGDGWAANIDAAFTYFLFTGSLNAKVMNADNGYSAGAQLEATVWFLLNMGGGIGYLFGEESGPAYHFFLGLPIPGSLAGHTRFGPFTDAFIEPYYRPFYFEERWIHELGVLVKVTTYQGL